VRNRGKGTFSLKVLIDPTFFSYAHQKNRSEHTHSLRAVIVTGINAFSGAFLCVQ
jgi:hypothetical protein